MPRRSTPRRPVPLPPRQPLGLRWVTRRATGAELLPVEHVQVDVQPETGRACGHLRDRLGRDRLGVAAQIRDGMDTDPVRDAADADLRAVARIALAEHLDR